MTERVFITGGASGLGRALALHYARDGARILIADLNDERGESVREEINQTGGTGAYLHADVTSEEDMQAAAETVVDLWNGVDTVYNNAGIATGGGIDQESAASWERAVAINLLGVARGCRIFTPMLKAQGSGTIVNIASMAGLTHPPNMTSYCATKAGVVGLSESLHLELAPEGIHVSVVCPSFFATNLLESLETDDEHMRSVTERLLNRPGIDADEVAARVIQGVADREFVIIPHREARKAWWAKRFLPMGRYLKTMQKQTRNFIQR